MSIKDYPRGNVATKFGPVNYIRISATHVILETGAESITMDSRQFTVKVELHGTDHGEWGLHPLSQVYVYKRWDVRDTAPAMQCQIDDIKVEVVRAWNEFAAANPEQTLAIKRINLTHNLDRIDASIDEHADALANLQAQRAVLDRELSALDA